MKWLVTKQGTTDSKLPHRALFVILSQLCFDMTKLQSISIYFKRKKFQLQSGLLGNGKQN